VNLSIDGKVWPSVEHYFQAMKFPTNLPYQEEIRGAKTGAKAKSLGRKGEPVREDWETYRLSVMETALREKFSDRHPELKAKLLSTGNRLIRDVSPQDNFWGIGRKKLGQNNLGKLLMKIRQELQHIAPMPDIPSDLPVPAVMSELPAPIPSVIAPNPSTDVQPEEDTVKVIHIGP